MPKLVGVDVSGQPVGSILAIGTDGSVPFGAVQCNGARLDRMLYARLFSIIGTRFGNPDAGGFNVPNLIGKTIVGEGTTAGLTTRTVGQQNIGSETVTLTTAQIPGHEHTYGGTTGGDTPVHTHSWTSYRANGSNNETSPGRNSDWDGAVTHTSGNPNQSHGHSFSGTTANNTGGGNTHENMPPSAVCRYVIFYV